VIRAGKERLVEISLVGGLLAVFALQAAVHVVHKSPTFDEPTHLSAGYSYLTRWDFRMNVEHPPLIKQIAALPLLLQSVKPVERYPGWRERSEWGFSVWFLMMQSDPERAVNSARLMMLLLGVATGLLVYLCARSLWGKTGALVSLFLFALDPNMIAHGSLVTTDMGFALAVLVYLMALTRALEKGRWRDFALCGGALGLAGAAKYSFATLVPFTVIVLGWDAMCPDAGSDREAAHSRGRLCHVFRARGLWLNLTAEKGRSSVVRTFFGRGLRLGTALGLIGLVGALVLWADYGFETRPYPFFSFVKGARYLSTHMTGGHPTYFNGKCSDAGVWYYFPEVFALKTPVATLLAFLSALILTGTDGPARRRVRPFALFCFLYLAVACTSRIQIGYRHLLPTLPALFIICGALGPALQRTPLPFRIAAVAVFGGWLAISTTRISPNYLTYFNEIAGGPIKGKRFVADSNLDWGQDLKELAVYLARREIDSVYLSYFGRADPAMYGIRFTLLPSYSLNWRETHDIDNRNPPAGVYAISATNLVGQYLMDRDYFAWFRDKTPDAVIGNSIYVYSVRGEN